ncbi:threonine synthase [Actinomycetota bacterium]
MSYKSTRGDRGSVSSAEAVVRGIAPDGGLYVPSRIPLLDRPFDELINMDYRELAGYIMAKFFIDFPRDILTECIKGAYDSKYDDSRIVPVVEKSGAHFIELFHGPTLAFKDIALTFLPHLLKAASRILGVDKEIIILTATSGDTGKAALEGFSDIEGTRIIVFYPKGGVSKVQERQMTTQEGKNTYVIAVEGNFDDAQKGVKAIFGDREYGDKLAGKGYVFSSANSINIGRLVPQIVYYVFSYLDLIKRSRISAGEKINITVPTGNFGNILAAYYSKKMGLPVNRLICASNTNNVLYDFINTGIYDRKRKFMATSSPAMDILVSSNLERLLFDLAGEDVQVIRRLTGELADKGEFEITDEMKQGLSQFYGNYANDDETFNTIKMIFEDEGHLIDTHTAVGYNVYRKYLEDMKDEHQTVIASTASPFKFPGSVASAIDSKYRDMDEFMLLEELSKISGMKIPARIADISKKEVIHKKVCKIEEMKDTVSRILGMDKS